MTVSTELNHEDMERTLASIDIPPCPAILAQVLSEAQKDTPDINVLATILASDVGMSAYAIKLANSALFRGSGKVTTVPKAVARLGTRNIICTVVAVSLRNNVIPGVAQEVLERFWDRAGQIALAASLTARFLRGIPPDDAYTYALFHDAGIPVMMHRFPGYTTTLREAETSGKSLILLEDERYHCHHAVVGSLMAKNWGLTRLLADGIRHHHDPTLYEHSKPLLTDGTLGLIASTHIAEQLVNTMNAESDPEGTNLFQQATIYLGLSEEDIQELTELCTEALSG